MYLGFWGCIPASAQPGDVHVDGAGRHVALIFPDFLQQLFAGYDGTSLLHEVLQELKLFAGETDRHAALSDITTFEVHRDVAKRYVQTTECAPFFVRRKRASQTSKQFRRIEGLRQVIIGAEPEFRSRGPQPASWQST